MIINNTKGMTLLEVIISVALFSVIAVSLMRMTDTTIQYQKKITQNITDIHYQRNFLQILRKDLRNVFFIYDINAKLQTLYIQRIRQTQQLNLRGSPIRTSLDPIISNNPYFHSTDPQYGGVKGTQDSLHIGSFSNIRTQKDEKASDQNIISYYLKPCKSRLDTSKEMKSCLWKRVSKYPEKIIEDPETFEEYVLLEDVVELHIAYFNIFNNSMVNLMVNRSR